MRVKDSRTTPAVSAGTYVPPLHHLDTVFGFASLVLTSLVIMRVCSNVTRHPERRRRKRVLHIVEPMEAVHSGTTCSRGLICRFGTAASRQSRPYAKAFGPPAFGASRPSAEDWRKDWKAGVDNTKTWLKTSPDCAVHHAVGKIVEVDMSQRDNAEYSDDTYVVGSLVCYNSAWNRTLTVLQHRRPRTRPIFGTWTSANATRWA